MKNILSAVISMSLLTLSACGGGNSTNTDGGTASDGGSGGGSGGGLPPTAAQAAATQAAIECYGFTCLFTASPAACDALTSAFGSSFDVAASVAAGRMAYDPAKGQACKAYADGLLATSCYGENSPLDMSMTSMPPEGEACEQMFTGKVANGASCYDTDECSAGYCDFSNAACPGTCAAKKAAAADCDRDEECQAGLECGNSGSCAAPLAKGATCGNGAGTCGDGLFCDASGKCSDVKVAVGATCTDDDMCPAGAACIRANFMSQSGTCKAKAGAGGSCSSGGVFIFGLSPECKGAQVCAGLQTGANDAVVTAGSCAAPQGVGATCYPNSNALGGNGCFVDLVCDPASKKCAAAPAVGKPCITGRCATDAYCNASNTCVAKKADGASCTQSDECVGDCNNGTCGTQPDDTCKP